MSDDDRTIADLLAKMFITRRDVKAVQQTSGAYFPEQSKWTRADILAHMNGERTLGHYMLDTANTCKLFAFDLDWEKEGMLPTLPMPETNEVKAFDAWRGSFALSNPRDLWHSRRYAGRGYMKYKMRMEAAKLMRSIHDVLGLHTACAYSGNKGLHVYGFTTQMDAEAVREAAMIVIDSTERYAPTRGKNFYQTIDTDDFTGAPQLSIEVFPKQTHISEDGYGNLMRLPLGRNLKNPKDPTFFLDSRAPMGEITPIGTVQALTENPWR